MRFKAGLIEILLENEDLTWIVALPIDGELDVAGSRRTFSARPEMILPTSDSDPGLAVNSAYKIMGTSDFLSCSTLPT